MRISRCIVETLCFKQGAAAVSHTCDIQAVVTEGSVGTAALHFLHTVQQVQQHVQHAASGHFADHRFRHHHHQQQQQQQTLQLQLPPPLPLQKQQQKQHWQQQKPAFATQLLQRMGSIHQLLHNYHTSAVKHVHCAQQQQQQQQQCVVDSIESARVCSHMLPYQAAAAQAAITHLTAGKQRTLLRLPPCSDITHIITQLATHYHKTHIVLVLVSSSSRALQLKAVLQQMQQTSAANGSLNPRVVPGELLKPHDTVLLVDLEQLERMPSVSIQLLQQQTAQHSIAVYEEGFVHPSSSSSSDIIAVHSWHLLHNARRTAAEQLLRQLKLLEPNPGRLLVSISSRGWYETLHKQQQQQQQHSGSSSSTDERHLQTFELTANQMLQAGLIKQPAAVKVSTGIAVPVSAVAAADTTAAAAAAPQHSQQASSSSDALHAISTPERNALVAETYRGLAHMSKAVAYAVDELHARQLAVTLNLQGVSSLVLHQAQNPEDQAAVLDAFTHGLDRVLVSSVSADSLAAVSLGCDVGCVLMAAPTLDPRVYAARLAPVLLPNPDTSSGSSRDPGQLTVVDFADQLIGDASNSSSSSSRTAAALCCRDVLGSTCSDLPLPQQLAALTGLSSSSSSSATDLAAAAAEQGQAAPTVAGSRRHRRNSKTATLQVDSSNSNHEAAASSNDSKSNSSSSSSSAVTPTARGDLIWTTLDNGSWAIPIKRGRGMNLAGIKILWLSKSKSGWIPQLEEGLGQMSPLPGTSGKPIKLQRARSLAEAWMKARHPNEAAIRQSGMEWRDRPISDQQVMFCERHKIPYDPSWSRGMASNAVDRYVVETMRVPATERQLFLARHMAPFAPSYLVNPNSTTLMYRQAAEHMIEALLTGNFTKTSARLSGAAAKAEAAAAAAAVGSGTVRQSVGDTVGRDEVLPSRVAMLRDLEMQCNAGLRPRYTWTVINGCDMVLDLMSGSYLWLKQVMPASTTAAAAAAESSSGIIEYDTHSANDIGTPPAAAAAAAAVDSSSTAVVAAVGLDAAAPYHVLLQLPDNSFHQITGAPAAAAAALLTAHAAQHTNPHRSSSSSNSSSSAKPVTLAAALSRAERIAAGLALQGHAFLSREASVRLAGMVGSWKVPSKQSEQNSALPASARQLELLRAAGLPHSRRYTCLDAHRELVRHTKTHNLPEPLATASQLARIQELKIPVAAGAAAGLTAAEAKALLFWVQLADERRQEEAAKQQGKGPIMGRMKPVGKRRRV